LPAVLSEASEDANTVLLKGATEQVKQDCDSDEIAKTDTKEQEETTVNTVAKSLKCNEYVILSIYILGRKSCSFLCIKLSFSPAVPQKLIPSPVASLQCIYIFVIPFYLQSVPVHSANCVKTYTMACRRVLSNALL
jgi:hypothetical protein